MYKIAGFNKTELLRTAPDMSQQFLERSIGTYGDVFWPARSLDLAALDFFLWGWANCPRCTIATKTNF